MELCRALLTEQVGRDLWMGLWALEPGTILWSDLVGRGYVVPQMGLDLGLGSWVWALGMPMWVGRTRERDGHVGVGKKHIGYLDRMTYQRKYSEGTHQLVLGWGSLAKISH